MENEKGEIVDLYVNTNFLRCLRLSWFRGGPGAENNFCDLGQCTEGQEDILERASSSQQATVAAVLFAEGFSRLPETSKSRRARDN